MISLLKIEFEYMSNKSYLNAEKILKRTKKRCPECDFNGLWVILRNDIVDNVTYSKKYLFCNNCEYEVEYKNNSHNHYDDLDFSLLDF